MEHLQKIIFLISLFLPVMLSFALGLWYAWAKWFKDSTAFHQAIDEYHALGDDLNNLYESESKMAEKWEKSLMDNQRIITKEVTKVVKDDEESKKLSLEIKKLKAQVSELESHMEAGAKEFKELNDKNTALESKVSSKEKFIVTKESDYLSLKKSYDELISSTDKDKAGEKETPKALSKSVDESAEATNKKDDSEEDKDFDFTEENIRHDGKLGIIFNERPDKVDDLKKIKGVAKVLEEKLHNIGIYRFDQIVKWTPEQVDLFSEKLSFPDRIKRDDWQKQAAKFKQEQENIS